MVAKEGKPESTDGLGCPEESGNGDLEGWKSMSGGTGDMQEK